MRKKLIRTFFFFFYLCTIPIGAQIVHRLEVDRFTHYRSDDWISYAPAMHITSIDIDPTYIYFATLTGGILRFDKYAENWDYPFTTSNGLRSNEIHRVVYDRDSGRLYALTPAGIDCYNPADKFWQPALIRQMPRQSIPQSSVFPDTQEIRQNRFPPMFRPGNEMLPDFFTPVSMMFVPPDIIYDQYNRDFRFTDRITDSWQRVWIGTDGFGPLEADLYTMRLTSHQQSISGISPRDAFIDGDYMWIGGIATGMKIGGISLWNRHDNKWQYYEARMLSSLSRDEVHAITGNYDFIAFATDLGVAIYQPERDRWQTLSVFDGLEGNMINDVLADDKYIYSASEYGFNWIDPENKRVYDLTGSVLNNVAVNQLAIDDSSLIWAATRFGLYSISIASGQAEFHTSRATVSDYNLTAVEAVGREIWFAGSYGISYWQRDTDEWHSFPALEINTDYRDIGVTNNFIWFATDKGLLKYDRKRDYWRMYTEADGMISRDVYHIEVEGNYLWLSTARGITKFRWRRKGRLD